MSHHYYIGLMSGTSMDAIDAVIVDFNAAPLKLIATHSDKIPEHLKKIIHEKKGDMTIREMGGLDREFGKLFANSVLTLLKKSGIHSREIKAIGSHGQTIFHAPTAQPAFTIQIGDPNTIAALTEITTVADFRRRDIALSGQGAPLTSAFHEYLLRSEKENRWVLNIGGIANVTFLPKNSHESVLGFDTGPGNILLDQWCYQHQYCAFDQNGEWAKSGAANIELLNVLLSDPYFKKSIPKSTGTDYFNLNWLNHYLGEIFSHLSPADVQATLVELTAATIHQSIEAIDKNHSPIWICGGGAHNNYLLQRLATQCVSHTITTTAEIGIDPDWIEAVAFAWLAKQTLENKPSNLPSVTGAKKSAILGGIYPNVT